MPKNSYIVGLDIRTKKTSAIISKTSEDKKPQIAGIGMADSQGLKKGVVVNLESTVNAIKKAQEEAELMAGVEIDSVCKSASSEVSGDIEVSKADSETLTRRKAMSHGEKTALFVLATFLWGFSILFLTPQAGSYVSISKKILGAATSGVISYGIAFFGVLLNSNPDSEKPLWKFLFRF